MPLSELLRMASGKLESGQSKPNASPVNLSTIPENDFVELLWENGHISQTNKLKRNNSINDFLGQNTRTRDKYLTNGTSSRVGKVSSVEPLFNQPSPVVNSGEMDFSQDDDMATWLNMDQDYNPHLLPEVSGITMHEPLNQNNSFQTMDKRINGSIQTISNSQNGSGSKSSLLSSWSSLPVQRSVVSDFPSKNGDTQPSSGMSNFSFLSRQTAHRATSSSSAMEKIDHKEKARVAMVSSFILPEKELHNQPGLGSNKNDNGQFNVQPCEESLNNDALCGEDHGKNEVFVGSSSNKGVNNGEKIIEPVVASSSVCSGSSADRGSSDQTQTLKRKGRDNEESEDVEEESVGVKKAGGGRGGTGSKRSRAAEVHNLSERRRRDRINEKMRALQELIPNCNKADKASMLDEAIEYLKTLQLQVQMMSMGAGMCMPQMMFPSGMQQLHAATHMPHYPSMGMGMGMGYGMGMGMLDMTRGSPVYPLPTMPRAHFASPQVSGTGTGPGPVPGPTSFHSLGGSVYGHPTQGHPISIPRAPFNPSLPGQPPLMNGGSSRMGFHGDIPYASPPLNSKDPMTQLKMSADVSSSMNETSQVEKVDQSNQANQVTDAKENVEGKLLKGNDPVLEKRI